MRLGRTTREVLSKALLAGALCVYVTLTLGLQNGAGWAARRSSGVERYPCESCACGCASARECWTACCCHTPHERLVWALTQGVMPPESVRFSDEQWITAANAVRSESASCAACVAEIKQRLARGVAWGETRAVQSASSCCGSAECATPVKAPSRGGLKLPRTVSPLSCKSIQQLPLFLPTTVVCSTQAGFAALRPSRFEFVRILPQTSPSRVLSPPAPPPRCS